MITSWGTKRCATGTSLLLLLITAQSQALDFTCTTNNGTITITCYDGKRKVLIVPSSINGLPVTSIGEGVFSNCIHIKIPNTITNIGRGAFKGYFGLIDVYKPANLGGGEYRTNLSRERMTLPLDKITFLHQQVLIEQCLTTPGPWTVGHWFTILNNPVDLEPRRLGMADVIRWRVINMNMENFREITRRLGLTSVEVEVVRRTLWREAIPAHGPQTTEIVQIADEGDCIITDARIPKEWLR